MKIKKLEILGFKSFAEKTSFTFPPGVTAIVGPNGCGKSNIVDAIKWVLGEQGAKTLRGRAMEDVIFNGSEKRKPTGMAEVTLTFSNENGAAPRQYSEFSEISVRRRLYRSGDSEYYINNSPCRLKDITELFLDTGIGSKAYSIIGQNHINWLINSKPEERRFVLEEVAGIHKYRVRKDTSLRKLDATKQNLIRVEDIVHEVKRQIRFIHRQAKKAERFKTLKEEIKGIELSVMGKELRSFIEKRVVLDNEFKRIKDRELASRTSLKNKEEKAESERLVLLDKEKEIQAAGLKLSTKENEIKDNERGIEITELKMANLETNIERMKREIEELTLKSETLETKNLNIEEELKELSAKMLKAEEELRNGEVAIKDIQKTILPARGDMEENKRKLVKHIASLTQIKNSLANQEETKVRLLKNIEKSGREIKEIDALLLEKGSYIEKLKEDADNLRKIKAGLEAEAEILSSELGDLQSDKTEKEEELHLLRQRLTLVSSKLIALKETNGNGDAIAKTLSDQKDVFRGIHGMVADIFTTQIEFEKALESILGERLHCVIVESHKEGMDAIAYLKEKGKGRGSFIPLKPRKKEGVEYTDLNKFSLSELPTNLKGSQSALNTAVPILDKVQVKEGYADIARCLLSDILIVNDLAAAVGLWMTGGLDKTLVTLDGDMLDPDGVLTGGSVERFDQGILKRKREIRELAGEEERFKKEEAKLTDDLETLNEKLALNTKKLNVLREENHEKEIKLVSLESERRTLEGESASLKQRREIVALEENEAREELETSEKQAEGFLSDKALLEETIKKEEALIEADEERIEGLENERKRVESELTEKKVQVASLKGRLESLNAKFNANKEELAVIRDKINRRREEIDLQTDERCKLSSSIDEWKKVLIRDIEAVERLREEKLLLEEDYSGYAERLNGMEDAIKGAGKEYNKLQERLSALMLDIKEIDMRIEHLLERASEKYGAEREDILNLSEIESCEKSEKDLNTLKMKLDSLGDVNLAAIDELKELEERHDFLTSQRDDLITSMESLKKVIQRINKVSRVRFLKAFEEVNDKFQEIYTKFFDGGKAGLKMLEEDNPLDTGIDIVAQPKGKRLQSITLLSGGEKALTVLSLIFSLFLVKPSPFFLLDEADAPLDDANTLRFVKLVKVLSEKSQFLLMTHNKNTMELADTLYGITMQEPGVSSLLSVNLNEV